MKTNFPRFSSLIAALLLSFGFARAAQAFDVIGYDQPSANAADAAAQCTSSCWEPDRS